MEHASVDEIRTHTRRVDARPKVGRQLAVETVREADTAMLRGAVVSHAGNTDEPRDTRYVDDVTVVSLQHRRQETLHRLGQTHIHGEFL